MVVAAEHYRCADFAAGYGLVHGERYLGAAFRIGVENTCLRSDDEFVLSGLADPEYVVVELSLDFVRCGLAYFTQYAERYLVRFCEVFRFAGCTYPAERAESVVEEHRTHYILYV